MRALAIREVALGAHHQLFAQSLNNLALIYRSQNRNDEAADLYRRAIAVYEAALGLEASAVATPLSRGRRSPVWECAIRDDKQRLVATGRVRMLVLDAGVEIAGETVVVAGMKSP